MNYEYIAGFLDAEGYIHLKKDYGSIQIGLINTERSVLEEMKKFLRIGSIQEEQHDNIKWMTTYRYVIVSNQAKSLLLNIKDHLVIKKESAKLALEFNPKTHDVMRYRELIKKSRLDMDIESHICNSYLAGFVDGEGSITIIKNRRKNRPSPLFTLQLRIVNIHPGILRSIQKSTGGFIHRRTETEANHNQTYDLIISSNEARIVLESILPFLTLKKNQAKIAIKFQTLKSKRKNYPPLTDREVKLYESYRLALHKLHSHGKTIKP